MVRRDSMDLLAILLLLIGHGTEDGSENHTGSVDKG